MIRRTEICTECRAYKLTERNYATKRTEVVFLKDCICHGLALKKGMHFWRELSQDKVVRKKAHVRFVKKPPLNMPVERYERMMETRNQNRKEAHA